VIDRHRQYIKRASIQPEPDYYNTGSPRGDKNILFPGILSTTVLHALRITTDRVLNRIIRLYNISPVSTRAHAHTGTLTYASPEFAFLLYACTRYIYVHVAFGKGPRCFSLRTTISFVDLAIFLVEFVAQSRYTQSPH